MKYLFSLLVIAAFLGCSVHKVEVNQSVETIHKVQSDVEIYPQHIEPYVNNIQFSDVNTDEKKFLDKYYEPWSYIKPPESLKTIQWPFSSYTIKDAYGLNLQPIKQTWFDKMKLNANYGSFGSLNSYAITLKQVDLRSFTSDDPLFHDPTQAGEGFPFDYIQNSSIHTNEPLYLSHYSKDRKWVFVFSSYAAGWLHVEEIKTLNTNEIQKITKAKQIYIIRDNIDMYSKNGSFVTEGKIGVILPLLSEDANGLTLLAIGNEKKFTSVKISKEVASQKPLHLQSSNVIDISNDLLQTEYGWGGMFNQRDCSSTMKDFFTPFGVWLPRNSFQQKQVGKTVSLETLSADEKIATIIKKGIPFKTLLYRPGHIVLYIGTYQNEIMILQNMWGIKIIKDDGSFGREVIGKTVISTLEIGKELENVDEENLLINKITQMNIIME